MPAINANNLYGKVSDITMANRRSQVAQKLAKGSCQVQRLYIALANWFCSCRIDTIGPICSASLAVTGFEDPARPTNFLISASFFESLFVPLVGDVADTMGSPALFLLMKTRSSNTWNVFAINFPCISTMSSFSGFFLPSVIAASCSGIRSLSGISDISSESFSCSTVPDDDKLAPLSPSSPFTTSAPDGDILFREDASSFDFDFDFAGFFSRESFGDGP
mmetsp:Transcript_8638/g.24263  ORF Transcript_8638/g.24263 Transcript_8638/m.24263 type:complete len:220 (-) Transcript_8638:2960-3619(-)